MAALRTLVLDRVPENRQPRGIYGLYSDPGKSTDDIDPTNRVRLSTDDEFVAWMMTVDEVPQSRYHILAVLHKSDGMSNENFGCLLLIGFTGQNTPPPPGERQYSLEAVVSEPDAEDELPPGEADTAKGHPSEDTGRDIRAAGSMLGHLLDEHGQMVWPDSSTGFYKELTSLRKMIVRLEALRKELKRMHKENDPSAVHSDDSDNDINKVPATPTKPTTAAKRPWGAMKPGPGKFSNPTGLHTGLRLTITL